MRTSLVLSSLLGVSAFVAGVHAQSSSPATATLPPPVVPEAPAIAPLQPGPLLAPASPGRTPDGADASAQRGGSAHFPPVGRLYGSGAQAFDAPVWRVEQSIHVPTLDGVAVGPPQVSDLQLTLTSGSFTVPFVESALLGAPLPNLVLLVTDPITYDILRVDLVTVQVVALQSEYDPGEDPWETVALRAEQYQWTWLGSGPSAWVRFNTTTQVLEGGAVLPPELIFRPEGLAAGDEFPYLDVDHALAYEPPPPGGGTGQLEVELYALQRRFDVHTIAVLSACLQGAVACASIEVRLPDPDGYYDVILGYLLESPVLGSWTLSTTKSGRPVETLALDFDKLTWSTLDGSDSTTYDP